VRLQGVDSLSHTISVLMPKVLSGGPSGALVPLAVAQLGGLLKKRE
jgi:hypothetical protein